MLRHCLIAAILTLFTSLAQAAGPDDQYKPGPDAQPKAGVPKGVVTKLEFTSKIFPSTVREYFLYVPAQYKADKPACLMVFQDGHAYVDEKGPMRATIVFDNLIAAGEMPVTIGLFINPGGDPAKRKPGGKTGGWGVGENRSFEYDTLSDQYARFLIEEIIPEVGKTYKLTEDPEGRAICGMSSGGICAFTAAWYRPDYFRKVLSHIGSFTGIAYRPATADKPMQPGGDLYPTLIRKNPIKPLRIFLQDGSNDLDNEHGNWFLANQQMLSSLNWANANADKKKAEGPRYDVNHSWGEGSHSPRHGGQILPESLRWLWRDYKPKA